MRVHFLWLVPCALLVLWDQQAELPMLPSWTSGTLLIGLGLLAGLRISADSAAHFSGDLMRLNRFLAGQNRDLAEANHSYLKRFQSGELDEDFQLCD